MPGHYGLYQINNSRSSVCVEDLLCRYYEPDRNKSWEDNQNQVSTFNTVEDFWSLFTHIKQPSEVKIGSDYSLFKESIRPMWEDKANKNGGRWMITLNRNQRPELDRYWIDTVRIAISMFNWFVITSMF